MSVFEKTLDDLKNGQQLAIFMREFHDLETFTGILVDYNEYVIYLSLVSDDGLHDGIVVFHREQLSRIRWGNKRLESIYSLYLKKNPNLVVPEISIETHKTTLSDIEKHYGYICVSAEDLDDVTLFLGEIEAMDDDYVVIYEFANKDHTDRSRLLFPLSEITSIQGGGQYEEDIRFLNVERSAK